LGTRCWEDHKFEVNLDYIVRLFLKTKQKTTFYKHGMSGRYISDFMLDTHHGNMGK
jgi:hypothetical protein